MFLYKTEERNPWLQHISIFLPENCWNLIKLFLVPSNGIMSYFSRDVIREIFEKMIEI